MLPDRKFIIDDALFGQITTVVDEKDATSYMGWAITCEGGHFHEPQYLAAYEAGQPVCVYMERMNRPDILTAYNLAPDARPGFMLRLNNVPAQESSGLVIYAVASSGLFFPLTPLARLDGRTTIQLKHDLVVKLLWRIDNCEISKAISPKDDMMDEHYTPVGISAAQCVINAISDSYLSEILHILDMPCGHGRVTRYLRALFPYAMIDCADINHDGVAFCEREFAARGLYIGHDISETQFPVKYDLIWVGSMLTHFREETVKIWLRRLLEMLSDNGIAVVTFHGRKHLELYKDVYNNGFKTGSGVIGPEHYKYFLENYAKSEWAYADVSGKPITPDSVPYGYEYGISVGSPENVLRILQEIPGARIISFSEAGWAEHQDCLVFGRYF